MLRISHLEREDGSNLLKLEGRLVGPWVDLLRDHSAELAANGVAVALDLCQVSFASREGLELLDRLKANGVDCVAVSPILREMFLST